jgi:hypothetical protein
VWCQKTAPVPFTPRLPAVSYPLPTPQHATAVRSAATNSIRIFGPVQSGSPRLSLALVLQGLVSAQPQPFSLLLGVQKRRLSTGVAIAKSARCAGRLTCPRLAQWQGRAAASDSMLTDSGGSEPTESLPRWPQWSSPRERSRLDGCWGTRPTEEDKRGRTPSRRRRQLPAASIAAQAAYHNRDVMPRIGRMPLDCTPRQSLSKAR